ncbi:MAG: hypothetical protein II184_07965, partial [Clostridia bacterium]|nr:hypothetical protein [Clostridia bacterium]
MEVKKSSCKRFAQLKQAGRRSRFLKNERFFTFFKKTAEQRLQLRSQLPTALLRTLVQPRSISFIRILAHFYPAFFDFLNKSRT